MSSVYILSVVVSGVVINTIDCTSSHSEYMLDSEYNPIIIILLPKNQVSSCIYDQLDTEFEQMQYSLYTFGQIFSKKKSYQDFIKILQDLLIRIKLESYQIWQH